VESSEGRNGELENLYKLARLAVDKAKLCPVSTASQNPPPRVGIVLAKDGVLLGWAAKGFGGEYIVNGEAHLFKVQPHEHAEQALIAKLNSADLIGASAYVTLEPCAKRRRGKSCAELLVSAGMAVVHIGNSDPNPDVGALAWRLFFRHGIAVKDFPGDLRNEARRDNDAFFANFRWSHKKSGSAAFDYEADGGERILGPAGYEFKTRWTNRGQGSIYALDYDNNVCIEKNCLAFDQVDDPGRWMEDSHYTKPVNEGEIVIFRNEHGFALVKVLRAMPRIEGLNAELHFAYELRYK
jgi:diaminohydroxyphosphoribosylaminopyrimidine deaminase/5-amino-6-(5-phosphoribosylamino)uracil reductase